MLNEFNTPAFRAPIGSYTISATAAPQTGSSRVEPEIWVMCEMCECSQTGTRPALQRGGWGIFGGSAFCPFHQEMV